MENLSDTYYIHRILEGNTSCFACLLDKYSHPLFNLIYRIVGNKEDAEELTEDVFMKAFQQLESFEGRGDFSNWLYKIAYNMSITAVRKKKVELLAIDDFQLTNASSDFLDESAEDTAERHQQLEWLEKALGALTVDERALVLLFYKEEKKIEEIASISGLSVSNTKVKLHRIRKKLGEMVNEERDKNR